MNMMNMTDTVIRMATPEDADALLQIYAPYILYTGVTFEYEVPTETEFRDRIRKITEKYPYLVACRAGTPSRNADRLCVRKGIGRTCGFFSFR